MKKIALAIAAAAALSGSSAFAQGYVGGGIGQGHINIDCSGASSCSTSGTGYKIFGGYKFGSNVAAEVNYFDFGKADISGGGASLQVKATGLGVGVAFFGDFSPQWSGVARLGIASNRMKGDAAIVGFGSGSLSESSTNAYFGLGVGYEISKGLALTGAIDFSNGKIAGETGSLRLWTVGLTYGF
ncbi:MAG TPA: outer membrane beta-barrel protein [Albitalea sp.]|jgi:OOP family OmpA-OmpF porin|nr:outer membrane beta-barrel protein [Albitalea sp.]